MKLLYWTTHLNGEILAHLRHAIGENRHEILVAYDHWESFQKEACQRLWPLSVRVIPRLDWRSQLEIQKFGADVALVDDLLPPFPVASRVFVIWHGFGWKGPQDRMEMDTFLRQSERLVGPVVKANPRFAWKAYGEFDRRQRIEKMGMAPENVVKLGMAAGDDFFLRDVDPSAVREFYPFDPVAPTVLVAPTWHYGDPFYHWGGTDKVLTLLADSLRKWGVNMILRMHDRLRYSAGTVNRIQQWRRMQPHVMVKFQDENVDNTVDMMISSVLLTNFSSIANTFYASRKPTVHWYPLERDLDQTVWRKLKCEGLASTDAGTRHNLWKLELTENGGSLAMEPAEMIFQVREALDNPRRDEFRAQRFLETYMHQCDGHTCGRITGFLEDFVTGTPGCYPPILQAFRPGVLRGLARSFFNEIR
ncbi:hypothetical protein KKD52_18710 [Myxococcota bacterium]|nr:hypothetical protein [Myxococcota bacterium]MBU1413051.1 hypothetical protein [Myxococcota bacterium]MBU1512389.1 hypothetical protein [Myxococcota bacterium]